MITGNNKLKFLTIFFVSSLFLASFICFTLINLQAKAEPSGQALSISPPVLELSADPGQSVTASIKLTNISSGDLLIKNQINDFGAKNETGEPNIIFNEAESTSYSLHNWVVAPAPFIIKSKQSKTVDFQINVPKDAEPGGHYAVFRFTGQAPELEETGVALSASLGSLVLLKVSGDVKEQATVSDFYSSNDQFQKQWFFENSPINFLERIKNEGNTHINPTGTIEIFDIFNRKVDTLPVNGNLSDPKNKPRAILPNSVRRFEQTLNKAWLFGPYTAKLKLAYGDQNKNVLTSSSVFWVVPYKLILTVLLIAIVLILLIRFLNKRYKQRIIDKYAQQSERNGSQNIHKSSNQHKSIKPKSTRFNKKHNVEDK